MIVVESWEGTHNTLCAQVLRDFSERGLHQPWLDHLRTEVDALDHPASAAAAEIAKAQLDVVAARISQLLDSDPPAASAQIRHVVDHVCRVSEWVALATQHEWEKTWGVESDTADALELYRLTRLEKADPIGAPELIDLNRRFSEEI